MGFIRDRAVNFYVGCIYKTLEDKKLKGADQKYLVAF